jgi:4-oxalomesaconate tautomerase
VSVATACRIPGSVAAAVCSPLAASRVDVEHPSGFFSVDVELQSGAPLAVRRAALLRTARKLMRGEVFVPSVAWQAA